MGRAVALSPVLSAAGEAPLSTLPGVGPRVAEKLAARGLLTLQDLWLQLPRQYEDRTRIVAIRDLRPGIAVQVEGVVEAVERYGIRFLRMPEEVPLPPFGYVVPDAQLERVAALNARTAVARALLAGTTIETADHFRGSTLLGNASKKNLRHILAKLPDGVTELMVHPSSPSAYGTPFDLDPQRITELQMLLDPELPKLLAERKIELTTYADL